MNLASRPLQAEDAEKMAQDTALQDSIRKAGSLIQEADEHHEEGLSGKKLKGGGKGRSSNTSYTLQEMKNVNCPPVKVDSKLFSK